MPKTIQSLRTHLTKNKIIPIIVVLAVAALGTYFLVGSHAATPYVAVTANSGTPTSPASTLSNCSGATDGSCVLFGTSSTGSSGGGSGPGTQTGCFSSPGKCGYPDPNYAWSASANAWATGGGGVGPTNTAGTQSVSCSSLPASGAVTAATAGQTIQNLNITGGLDVTASNVTVKNVCVAVNGGDNYDNGGPAISVEGSGVTIENSSFGGANDTTQATQQAITNSNDNVTLKHDYLHSCSECLHAGLSLTDSYVATTPAIVTGSSGEDHYEDWYYSDDTVVANHDTMFNSMDETAIIFGNTDSNGNYSGPADNHTTVTNSLLAGSGYVFYPDGNATSVGSSTMDITGNRIARCLSKNCPDANGYWPGGGSYGVDAYTYCTGSGQTWSDNVWDDDNEAISC